MCWLTSVAKSCNLLKALALTQLRAIADAAFAACQILSFQYVCVYVRMYDSNVVLTCSAACNRLSGLQHA